MDTNETEQTNEAQKLKEIEQLLQDALSLDEVHVTQAGTHYKIVAVGECFDGMGRVKQQQTIYGPLMDRITSGELHALTINAFTPTQWKREKIFNM
ncbi:BolA family transcriptional regulator [Shewanella psychropiezotolerans]|uniref:BolA family transcriptional regulator n=1 Tax=Shewanella psychropiezotolerans TaxID=2593655 RepID=A0ABX5WTD7_9GAMM|nr:MULTISPECIES: BolA family protein [Shewanella]MPY25124.1 BolA family transcriptional regulator [Shewanella sp. YLB-07]NRB24975.1 BolA family transcriptional regulator [Shewanella sp.]QDO82362.1 BolA family transcriptional regulator [Shewanella psychropiezotolerans]